MLVGVEVSAEEPAIVLAPTNKPLSPVPLTPPNIFVVWVWPGTVASESLLGVDNVVNPKEGTLLLDVADPVLLVSRLLLRVLLAGFGAKLNPPELDLSPPRNRPPPVVTPVPNPPKGDVPDEVGIMGKGLEFDEAEVPLFCPKRVPVVVEVLDDG